MKVLFSVIVWLVAAVVAGQPLSWEAQVTELVGLALKKQLSSVEQARYESFFWRKPEANQLRTSLTETIKRNQSLKVRTVRLQRDDRRIPVSWVEVRYDLQLSSGKVVPLIQDVYFDFRQGKWKIESVSRLRPVRRHSSENFSEEFFVSLDTP